MNRFLLFLFLTFGLVHSATASRTYTDYATYLEGSGAGAPSSLNKAIEQDGKLHLIIKTSFYNLPITTETPGRGLYYAQYDMETKALLAGRYFEDNTNAQLVDMIVEDGIVHLLVSSGNNYPLTLPPAQAPRSQRLFYTRLDAATGELLTSVSVSENDSFGGELRFFTVFGNDVHILHYTYHSSDLPVTGGTVPVSRNPPHIVYTRLNAVSGVIQAQRILEPSLGRLYDVRIHATADKVHLVLGASGFNQTFELSDNTLIGSNGKMYIQLSLSGEVQLIETLAPGALSEPVSYASITNYSVLKDNRLYLTGMTTDPAFPITTGVSYPPALSGGVPYYMAISTVNGEILLSTVMEGRSVTTPYVSLLTEDNSLYITYRTDNAAIPTTNGSAYAGGSNQSFLYKLNANTGAVTASSYIGNLLYSTKMVYDCGQLYLAGEGGGGLPYKEEFPVANRFLAQVDPATLNIKNAHHWETASSMHFFVSGRYADVVGTFGQFGVTESFSLRSNGPGWARFDLCGDRYFIPADTVGPAVQTVCAMDFIQVLRAPEVVIPPDSMPLLYKAFTPSPYEQNKIEAYYQWQSADASAGPWTDIFGAVTRNYQPTPISSSKYFRRVAYTLCCQTIDTLHITQPAFVDVTAGSGPSVHAGALQHTCPGSPVELGDIPVASGGQIPYTYAWYMGSDTSTVFSTLANPVVSPSVSTIYTVYVTDDNGCSQIGQASVVVHSAAAGADQEVCGHDSVRLEGAPIQGVAGVTYEWSPGTGLACTTCIQTMAYTTASTDYIYSVTIPKKAGSCVTSDTAKVIFVPEPPVNFAGDDVVLCYNELPALLGEPRIFNEINITAVSQTSVSGGHTGTVANLTDDIFSTGARTNSGVLGSWVSVDLGEITPGIGRVGLAAHTNIVELNGAVIQYSTNGTTWTQVGGTLSGMDASAIVEVSFASSVTARYLRVARASGFTAISLSEFRVYQTHAYQWSLGNKFVGNDAQYSYTFMGFPPDHNPAVHIVQATMGGCAFRDTVVAEVIDADAGVDGCGPRTIGKWKTDDPRLGETFLWEVISGGGTITGAANTATTTVSASPPGQPTTYRLTTTYKGHTCVDEVVVPDCGCYVELDFVSEMGCPSSNNGWLRLFPLASTGLGDSLGYEWTPQVGLSAYDTREVYVTDNVDRVYTLKVFSLLDTSLHCSDDIRVNHVGKVTPLFGAKDIATCPGAPVLIGDVSTPGFTYEWTPAIRLDDATLPNPAAVFDTAGFYTYAVEMTDSDECIYYDTAYVTVRPVHINAGPDLQVCLNGIITLGGEDTRPDYSYAWTPAAPWQNGTDSTFAQPDVLVANDLSFYLTATDLVTGCSLTDTVEVVVQPVPTLPDYPDKIVCPGSTVQIGADPLPGVIYRWTPATGLSDTTVAQPMASPLVNTEYTVTAYFPGTCDSVLAVVNVEVIDLSFTLTDFSYCPSGGVIALGADAPLGMSAYSWTPFGLVSNATIRNPNTQNPPPSVMTNFVLTITDANGCIARDTLTITPEVTRPYAGSNRKLCLGDNTELGSPLNTAGAGISYSWSPATGLSCTTCLNPIFTPSATGTYTFILSRTEDGCTSTDQVVATVTDISLPALPAHTICQDACVNIGFTPPQPGVSYFWSPATGLSSATVSNPVACVASSTNYMLTAVSPDGCSAQTTAAVAVSSAPTPVIDMPEVIMVMELPAQVSPNPVVIPAGDYTYLWSPNDFSVSNRYALNPVLTVSTSPKAYTLQVMDPVTGCIVERQVTILYEYSVLPVELIYFEAVLKGDVVLLDWKTASELNNDHFMIERSTDAVVWEEIGQVYGHGTTSLPHSYKFIDKYPLSGVSYYRFRQVDYDGNFSYSPVRSIEYSVSEKSEKIFWYPNPGRGEIRWAAMHTEDIRMIVITDVLGRIIFSADAASLSGNSLNVSYILPGTYFISFVKETGIQTDKLVIQH